MTTALYVPGTSETDPAKIIMSQQLVAGQTATNTDAIATLNAATYVNSIAGNSGAFTLNSTSGITNSTNDIKLQQASSSQFGAIKVDGTTITASGGVISAVAGVSPSPIKASLGADVALNNTANYFDGPSIAQGTTGTWWVSGTVSVTDTAGAAAIHVKLWDGTSVISSTIVSVISAGAACSVSLSGYLATPAGNLRISCKDVTSTNGKMVFNSTSNSKDSTISAYRIA